MVAVVVSFSDSLSEKNNDKKQVLSARVAVGSCSAVAQRLRTLEQDLVGLSADEIAAAVQPRHLDALSPIADVRATAEYRLDASLRLIQRGLNACVEAERLTG